MSTRAKMRAKDVADLPHVQAWMRRFRRLAAEMPHEVEVFIAAGTPSVLARSIDGESFTIREAHHMSGNDPDALIGTVAGGRWDGGDW